MNPRSTERPMFGVHFSREPIEEIAAEICRSPVPHGEGLRLMVTMNVDHVVNLRRNAAFRKAYGSAWKATIDGMPILLYAMARGIGVETRVTGASLFPLVFDGLRAGRHRPFFVAAHDNTARVLRDRLVAKGFAETQFDIHIPAFGFETDPAAGRALADRIRMLAATHIFFGVGAPKSEIWMDRHRHELGDVYGFPFGAALDFFAGTSRRAPRWMQQVGFEWFWRFAQQPRRMFRRYFIDGPHLVGAIIMDVKNNGTLMPTSTTGQAPR